MPPGHCKPTKVQPDDKDTKATAREVTAGTRGLHTSREKMAVYADPLSSLSNHMLL